MKYCGNCFWYDEVSPQTCQGHCWNYQFILKINTIKVNREFVCDYWNPKREDISEEK